MSNSPSSPHHSGPGRGKGEYAPLIDNETHEGSPIIANGVHAPKPLHPDALLHGSPNARRSLSLGTDRRQSLSERRASIPRRSLSRAATARGDVLEVHFASVEQKRDKWWRDALITCAFIASWFFFATLLSVYNKWMFSPKYLSFPFPLFVTTLHMFVQWSLASLVRWIWPHRFKPETDPSKKDYVTKAVPTAITTSLDIGLSNLSLKIVTLSFYTMVKSSSLTFVLLFAFLLHLERPSIRLISVIALITGGVLLMVATTTTFSLLGFILVLSASFLGGLRWGLTQILLKKRDMGMNNPAATIFWLAPSMGLTLAIVSMIVEGWINIWNSEFWARTGWFKSLVYLLSPGSVAFVMVMSEYYIITRAGVVPLSIAGIFKEVTTLAFGAWIYGDQFTELNIVGVVITITGIALYTYHKYTTALHSPVPLDAHGNPLTEDEAEEVLEVVRSSTLETGNEEGLRLLEEQGGEIDLPIDLLEGAEDHTRDGERNSEGRAVVRMLEEAAEGGHGGGEISGQSRALADNHPLFTVGDHEEFEDGGRVVAGRGEEESREVDGVGRGIIG